MTTALIVNIGCTSSYWIWLLKKNLFENIPFQFSFCTIFFSSIWNVIFIFLIIKKIQRLWYSFFLLWTKKNYIRKSLNHCIYSEINFEVSKSLFFSELTLYSLLIILPEVIITFPGIFKMKFIGWKKKCYFSKYLKVNWKRIKLNLVFWFCLRILPKSSHNYQKVI